MGSKALQVERCIALGDIEPRPIGGIGDDRAQTFPALVRHLRTNRSKLVIERSVRPVGIQQWCSDGFRQPCTVDSQWRAACHSQAGNEDEVGVLGKFQV